jgi:ubiquinone/menaquinone biosynthesis C-methylase UbiE
MSMGRATWDVRPKAEFAPFPQAQVSKDAYDFTSYCGLDRWSSYHYQLRDIFSVKPRSVLEVGVGDGVMGRYLKENTSIHYMSADIANDVGADVQVSVTSLPFADRSFDVVCAFQVLEHRPFAELEQSLPHLRRIARKSVLISVPHFGPTLKMRFKIPLFPEVVMAAKVPYPRKHVFDGEHYWELGKKGYPTSRFRRVLEKHFVVEREYIPFENPYHHFFVLKPLPSDPLS